MQQAQSTLSGHGIKGARTAPGADKGIDQSLMNLTSLADAKLGKDIGPELLRYFNVDRSDIYKETTNAGSADCWINAAEYHYLKNDRARLIQVFTKLIESGEMTRSDFTNPDAEPDQVLGSRKGASLAFDKAMERKYNSFGGANAYNIEQFESFLSGKNVVAIYNGQQSTGAIDVLLKTPELAAGTRAGLRWIPGSKHACHIVDIERVENGRVYFYQSVSIPGIRGPRRQWEGHDGLESMSINDFKKVTMSMWVPSTTAEKLKLSPSYDPAYYKPGDTSAEAGGQYIPGKGTFYPIEFIRATSMQPLAPSRSGKNAGSVESAAKNTALFESGATKDGSVMEYHYRDVLGKEEKEK